MCYYFHSISKTVPYFTHTHIQSEYTYITSFSISFYCIRIVLRWKRARSSFKLYTAGKYCMKLSQPGSQHLTSQAFQQVQQNYTRIKSVRSIQIWFAKFVNHSWKTSFAMHVTRTAQIVTATDFCLVLLNFLL